MASPAIVPRSVALVAETSAMNSEFAAAPSNARSSKSIPYQRVVKPTHSALSSESLNERMTTMASGR